MSYDYRAAIESTEEVLHRRGTLYRVQVVVVGAGASTVLTAAVFYGWRLLVVVGLLVPLVGTFFVGDARLVRRWRFELLEAWTRGEIDFMAFRHAIKAHPQLPPATLDAMLAILPAAENLRAEQAIPRPTREAVAATVVARCRRDDRVLMAKVAGAAVVSVLVVVAILAYR